MKILTIKELKEALNHVSSGDDNREVVIDFKVKLECCECDEEYEHEEFGHLTGVESNHPNKITLIFD